MPTLNDLIDGDAQRLDTGFTFTEGPLYHPLLLGDLDAEQIADDPRRLVPLALALRARDWCGRLAELGLPQPSWSL